MRKGEEFIAVDGAGAVLYAFTLLLALDMGGRITWRKGEYLIKLHKALAETVHFIAIDCQIPMM